VGIYLVDIGPDSWAHDEITFGIRSLLDHALAERGLGPYPGPLREVRPEETFEEKISPAMDGFTELCARYGAEDVLDAALFVPVPFNGLITLPTGNAYDPSTSRSTGRPPSTRCATAARSATSEGAADAVTRTPLATCVRPAEVKCTDLPRTIGQELVDPMMQAVPTALPIAISEGRCRDDRGARGGAVHAVRRVLDRSTRQPVGKQDHHKGEEACDAGHDDERAPGEHDAGDLQPRRSLAGRGPGAARRLLGLMVDHLPVGSRCRATAGASRVVTSVVGGKAAGSREPGIAMIREDESLS